MNLKFILRFNRKISTKSISKVNSNEFNIKKDHLIYFVKLNAYA